MIIIKILICLYRSGIWIKTVNRSRRTQSNPLMDPIHALLWYNVRPRAVCVRLKVHR